MKLVAANCPNCGAKIKVDENSDKTVCEYCNSQILVQDAIEKYKLEVSGEIEVKNLPKLENYLKLGERHYKNEEYEEAYNEYSKAIELDPDNYIAVLRKGICKSLNTNYANFEIDSAINGMKNTVEIIKSLKDPEKEKILKTNESIKECNSAISKLENFAIGFYKKSNLDLEELIDYIEKLKSCLNAFEYLYRITLNNDELSILILNKIIDTIDVILQNKKYRTGQYMQNGMPLTASYKLNNNYKKELFEKKQKYITKMQMVNPEVAPKVEKKIKKEHKEHKILCYIMVVFSAICTLMFMYYKSVFGTLIWLISTVIFIPSVKKAMLSKNVNKKIIFWCRIIIPIVGCMASADMPSAFENTWIATNGMQVQLSSENAIITTIDNETLKGTYTYSYSNSSYKITVTCNNSEKYTFYYERIDKEVSFYLKQVIDNVEEIIYFTPENPISSYEYVTE